MSKLKKAAQLIKQGDKSQRLKAIQYMGQSGDPRALKPLAWSVKNDPDPQVQQYAKKAYAHLKATTATTDNLPADSGASVYSTGSLYADDDPADSGASVYSTGSLYADDDPADSGAYAPYQGDSLYADDEPTDSDSRHDDTDGYDDDIFGFDDGGSTSDQTGPIAYDARREIRNAMEAHLDDDNDRAIKHLRRAQKIDKRTLADQQAKNIAVSITGMRPDAAINAVMDPNFDKSSQMQPDNSLGRSANKGDVSWGTAWTDIAIFWLVVTVGMVSLILVSTSRFTPFIEDIAYNPGSYPAVYADADYTPQDLQLLVEYMQSSVLSLIIGAVGIGFSLVITGFINNFVVHFAATNFFGGKKPSRVTLDALFNFQSVIYAIILGVTLLAAFSIPNDPQVYLTGNGFETAGTWIFVVGSLLSVVNLVSFVGQPIIVGRVQNIGFLSGCFAFIVGSLLLFALQCGFAFFSGFLSVFI